MTYTKLSDVTRRDCFPVPQIDDTLDTVDGTKWFSSLDVKNGYWQVILHPDDKEKTVIDGFRATSVHSHAL
jgi:hypothetical protein